MCTREAAQLAASLSFSPDLPTIGPVRVASSKLRTVEAIPPTCGVLPQ